MPVSAAGPTQAKEFAKSSSPNFKTVRLAGLDGLRGLLALYVAIFHLGGGLEVKYPAIRMPFIFQHGWYAVDVFFVLSGFVMAHVYGRESSSDEVSFSKYWRFMSARIARLYPVHLLTATVMLACLLPSLWGTERWLDPEGRYAWTAFVAALFMLQGVWIDHLTWNYPSWSISSEFHVYLIAPFLIRFIKRKSVAIAAVVFGVMLPLVIYLLYYPETRFPTNGFVTLLRAIPLFAVGVGVYQLKDLPFWKDGLLALVVVACSIALLATPGYSPFALLGVPMLVAVVRAAPRASALLSTRPLTFLGEISYSLYMVHALVQIIVLNRVVERLPPNLQDRTGVLVAALAGGVALSVGLAWLLKHWVEDMARPIVFNYLLRFVRPSKQTVRAESSAG